MEVFDLLVLGGGPGGYLCAERAAQNGLRRGRRGSGLKRFPWS